jgi:hypothetical protein
MNNQHLAVLIDLRDALSRAIVDHQDAEHYRKEACMWKQRYDELLDQSIKDSAITALNMVMMASLGGKLGE